MASVTIYDFLKIKLSFIFQVKSIICKNLPEVSGFSSGSPHHCPWAQGPYFTSAQGLQSLP